MKRIKRKRLNFRKKPEARSGVNPVKVREWILSHRAALLTSVTVMLLLSALVYFSRAANWLGAASPKEPMTLRELLAMPQGQRDKCDIARVNLLCAEGLPGAENVNINSYLAILDKWAAQIRNYTESNIDEFQKQPEKFKNNENFYRMVALISFVQRGVKVGYNPERQPYSDSDEVFFKESKDLFIHGLVDIPHSGTCASIPVLYVALGRRLGYPLYLVTTRNHLFARWESSDSKGSFNIEGTNSGLTTHGYEYYKKWPVELSETDVACGEYLHPLSPFEELAVFLSTRGICFQVNGLLSEAKAAYSQAASIAPKMKSCSRLASQKIFNQ